MIRPLAFALFLAAAALSPWASGATTDRAAEIESFMSSCGREDLITRNFHDCACLMTEYEALAPQYPDEPFSSVMLQIKGSVGHKCWDPAKIERFYQNDCRRYSRDERFIEEYKIPSDDGAFCDCYANGMTQLIIDPSNESRLRRQMERVKHEVFARCEKP